AVASERTTQVKDVGCAERTLIATNEASGGSRRAVSRAHAELKARCSSEVLIAVHDLEIDRVGGAGVLPSFVWVEIPEATVCATVPERRGRLIIAGCKGSRSLLLHATGVGECQVCRV